MIVDAGMNDMIRPTLYEAHHGVMPLVENHQLLEKRGDVVGPVAKPVTIWPATVNYLKSKKVTISRS